MAKKTYRNKGSKANIVISIAGAHGVGKTTIFNMLKKKLKNNNKFKFFPERYVKNPPFPFGSKDKQTSFRSEIHFLQQFIQRNKNIINFDKNYNGRIIILDRTPFCVLVYSKSLFLREKDYKLISDMYYSVDWREDYIIYLTATPETIMKRIIQRGSLEKIRKEWNEDRKDYLQRVLYYYDKLLISKDENNRVHVINTENLNQEEALLLVEEMISSLTGYSFKKIDKQPPTQMTLMKFIKNS